MMHTRRLAFIAAVTGDVRALVRHRNHPKTMARDADAPSEAASAAATIFRTFPADGVACGIAVDAGDAMPFVRRIRS